MLNFKPLVNPLVQFSVALMTSLVLGIFSTVVVASKDTNRAESGELGTEKAKITSEYKLQKATEKGEHKLRKYPFQELRRGKEGWAVLSYIVDVDGRVKDPLVLDSAGSERFAEVAKKALLGFEFYPALLNGKPIESANNKYKFMFSIKKTSAGASRAFAREYRRIRTLLDNKEFDAFLERAKRLKDTKTNNHYENSFYWLIMAGYYAEVENSKLYLSSLKKAISYEGEFLPRKMYASALSSLYYQQLGAGEVKHAFETATRIESYLKKRPELKAVLTHRDQLIEELKNYPTITTAGVVSDAGFWSHHLLRKNISLNVQSGNITGFEFRCEKQVRRFSFDQDGPKSMWKIPTKWGDCSLFVKGTVDAEFMLLESL